MAIFCGMRALEPDAPGPCRQSLAARGRAFERTCLAVLAISVGCVDQTVSPPAEPGPVRFDRPAVGQRSRYLFFTCDHYGSPTQGTQTYAPDTLQWVVRDRNGEWLRIEESLTPGSASLHGATNVSDPDSIYSYWLQIVDDSLWVDARTHSRILWSRTEHLYPLAPVAGPQTQFIGWQPDLPYHESLVTASVRDHAQLEQQFDRLNLLMDNRDMQFDGHGRFFAYAAESGFVRWATYGWWTRSGHGWDLLPN